MKKQKNKIEDINIVPYKLTPELLEILKKHLKEQRELLKLHPDWKIQLISDIEELEETILNAGVTQEMINKWLE